MAVSPNARIPGRLGALRHSPVSLRLSAYRALRHVAGPVLAHRVAFGFKGVCHG